MKYMGYTIQKSGSNYYVTDASGNRAFAEVPASVKTAKKWIDCKLAEEEAETKKSTTIRNALNFVSWHRRMVIEGNIKVNEYALMKLPIDCASDYDLQVALEGVVNCRNT